jgi:ferredoxin-thioredoxin reductase catalytic subunit
MINTQSPKEIAALTLKIRADSEKIAQRKGWILNPDTLIADSIIEGLARNKLMRGKLYCPCRPPNNNPDVDKCFICPCRDAEKDVEMTGHCHCYFFYMK